MWAIPTLSTVRDLRMSLRTLPDVVRQPTFGMAATNRKVENKFWRWEMAPQFHIFCHAQFGYDTVDIVRRWQTSNYRKRWWPNRKWNELLNGMSLRPVRPDITATPIFATPPDYYVTMRTLVSYSRGRSLIPVSMGAILNFGRRPTSGKGNSHIQVRHGRKCWGAPSHRWKVIYSV